MVFNSFCFSLFPLTCDAEEPIRDPFFVESSFVSDGLWLEFGGFFPPFYLSDVPSFTIYGLRLIFFFSFWRPSSFYLAFVPPTTIFYLLFLF